MNHSFTSPLVKDFGAEYNDVYCPINSYQALIVMLAIYTEYTKNDNVTLKKTT